MDEFELLYIDGPAAIQEQIANTWVSATEQERERILGAVNHSGILDRLAQQDFEKLIKIIMKLD